MHAVVLHVGAQDLVVLHIQVATDVAAAAEITVFAVRSWFTRVTLLALRHRLFPEGGRDVWRVALVAVLQTAPEAAQVGHAIVFAVDGASAVGAAGNDRDAVGSGRLGRGLRRHCSRLRRFRSGLRAGGRAGTG